MTIEGKRILADCENSLCDLEGRGLSITKSEDKAERKKEMDV